MRNFSTPLSANRLEPTKLAIAEAIFAVAGYAYLATTFDSLLVILMPIVLSPLLVLSTTRAGITAMSLLGATAGFYEYILYLCFHLVIRLWAINPLVLLLVAVLSILLLGPLVVVALVATLYFAKVGGIVAHVFRAPLGFLSELPRNWVRFVFCLDFAHFPETLRGAESLRYEFADRKSVVWRSTRLKRIARVREAVMIVGTVSAVLAGSTVVLRESGTHLIRETLKTTNLIALFIFLLLLPFGVALLALFLIPAYLLRLSIKSSFWFWLPLIWIASQARRGATLERRVDTVISSGVQAISRWWSVFVIVGFIAKLVIWAEWSTIAATWNAWAGSSQFGQLVTHLVWPDGIALWHIVSVLNAVLAWAVWIAAKEYRLKLNHQETVSERRVLRWHRCLNIFRTTATCYILACGLYIVATSGFCATLPKLDILLAPWASSGPVAVSDGFRFCTGVLG